MKNFVQPGKTLTLNAPYALSSGDGFLVGLIFAVANGAAAISTPVEGDTEGVFVLAKTTGAAWTQGQSLYWDNAGKKVTTVNTGNKFIGNAALAAASADTTGTVFVFPGKDVVG